MTSEWAQAIHSGQEIDAMYELSGARLLDEWFAFPEIPLLLFLC
jgi:hypothetical protein